MTNPNVPKTETISPETNDTLRAATGNYLATIAIPKYVKGIDGFAQLYLGKEEPNLSTLVTASDESLAVSVIDGEGKKKAFLNIDLAPNGDEVASVVAPGLYDKDGNFDAENGEIMRPVVRPLTEEEGRELASDLFSAAARLAK